MTVLQTMISKLSDLELLTITGARDMSSARQWRKGTTPSAKFLARLCDHFGKTATELLMEARKK